MYMFLVEGNVELETEKKTPIFCRTILSVGFFCSCKKTEAANVCGCGFPRS